MSVVGLGHRLAPLRVTDRDLSLDEEVLHGAQTVTSFRLRCQRILSAGDGGSITAEPRYVRVLLLLPRVVRHVTTLVTVNVGVAAGAICMVVHGLDGGRPLLGVTELPVGGRREGPILREAAFGSLIHLGVTAVFETDIGVTAGAICVVNPCFSNDLEEFA